MILKHAKNAFLYPQKEMDISLTMFRKQKPFWKLGLLCLDYLLKHLHEFYGVEKRTRVNLKTVLLLLLCMH